MTVKGAKGIINNVESTNNNNEAATVSRLTTKARKSMLYKRERRSGTKYQENMFMFEKRRKNSCRKKYICSIQIGMADK